MTHFVVIVVDVNEKPLSGKTVKACKQGLDKTCYTSITDQNGKASFDISAWNETVQLTAEGFSSGTTTINVDWTGKANPETITIHTSFNPTDQIGHAVTSLGDYFKGIGTLGIVIVAIIFVIILLLVIKKLINGESKLPIPKIGVK